MRTTAVILLLSLLALGCTQADQKRSQEAASSLPASQPASLPSSPADELAELDGRRPVPLEPMMAWHQKQNMMEHLVVIQRITEALAEKNWDEISQASSIIGTSPQMKEMCERMGLGAPGFTELALDFHNRADAIGAAAETHDVAQVLKATSNTLQACTSCHAQYRQDVVDAETWRARTDLDPQTSALH